MLWNVRFDGELELLEDGSDGAATGGVGAKDDVDLAICTNASGSRLVSDGVAVSEASLNEASRLHLSRTFRHWFARLFTFVLRKNS